MDPNPNIAPYVLNFRQDNKTSIHNDKPDLEHVMKYKKSLRNYPLVTKRKKWKMRARSPDFKNDDAPGSIVDVGKEMMRELNSEKIETKATKSHSSKLKHFSRLKNRNECNKHRSKHAILKKRLTKANSADICAPNTTATVNCGLISTEMYTPINTTQLDPMENNENPPMNPNKNMSVIFQNLETDCKCIDNRPTIPVKDENNENNIASDKKEQLQAADAEKRLKRKTKKKRKLQMIIQEENLETKETYELMSVNLFLGKNYITRGSIVRPMGNKEPRDCNMSNGKSNLNMKRSKSLAANGYMQNTAPASINAKHKFKSLSSNSYQRLGWSSSFLTPRPSRVCSQNTIKQEDLLNKSLKCISAKMSELRSTIAFEKAADTGKIVFEHAKKNYIKEEEFEKISVHEISLQPPVVGMTQNIKATHHESTDLLLLPHTKCQEDLVQNLENIQTCDFPISTIPQENDGSKINASKDIKMIIDNSQTMMKDKINIFLRVRPLKMSKKEIECVSEQNGYEDKKINEILPIKHFNLSLSQNSSNSVHKYNSKAFTKTAKKNPKCEIEPIKSANLTKDLDNVMNLITFDTNHTSKFHKSVSKFTTATSKENLYFLRNDYEEIANNAQKTYGSVIEKSKNVDLTLFPSVVLQEKIVLNNSLNVANNNEVKIVFNDLKSSGDGSTNTKNETKNNIKEINTKITELDIRVDKIEDFIENFVVVNNDADINELTEKPSKNGSGNSIGHSNLHEIPMTVQSEQSKSNDKNSVSNEESNIQIVNNGCATKKDENEYRIDQRTITTDINTLEVQHDDKLEERETTGTIDVKNEIPTLTRSHRLLEKKLTHRKITIANPENTGNHNVSCSSILMLVKPKQLTDKKNDYDKVLCNKPRTIKNDNDKVICNKPRTICRYLRSYAKYVVKDSSKC